MGKKSLHFVFESLLALVHKWDCDFVGKCRWVGFGVCLDFVTAWGSGGRTFWQLFRGVSFGGCVGLGCYFFFISNRGYFLFFVHKITLLSKKLHKNNLCQRLITSVKVGYYSCLLVFVVVHEV